MTAKRTGLDWLRAAVVAAVIAGCGESTSATPDAASPPDAPSAPGTVDAPPGAGVTFTRHVVAQPSGPAYVAIAQLGGKLALVVSSFGHPSTNLPGGTVIAYTRGATLDDWTPTTIVPDSDGVIFPNQPTVADVDGDGDDDVIVPSGFLVCAIPFIPGAGPCGAIAWYENAGATWERHALVTHQEDFFHHVEVIDLDGDQVPDLLTMGEYQPFGGGTNRAELAWLKGTSGGDRFEAALTKLADGGGSFPRLRDLDGDDDLDVASAQFFLGDASFVWFERDGATWTKHAVDTASGPAIELTFVENLTGDGTLKAIGSNHVNTAKSPPDPVDSAVFMFDVPADPTQPWTRHTISQGIVSRPGSAMSPLGAPGIFGVGDLDGDGDVDVAVSGDGDAHVYWLEQTAPGMFATHVLEDELGQAGGMVIADLDGDGTNELVVTGYEDDVIYVYARN